LRSATRQNTAREPTRGSSIVDSPGVDGERDDQPSKGKGEGDHDQGQPIVSEVHHQRCGGEDQRTEEGGKEQRVDDRVTNGLERTDEGPVVGPAQAGITVLA
jgi:hypothetical protein